MSRRGNFPMRRNSNGRRGKYQKRSSRHHRRRCARIHSLCCCIGRRRHRRCRKNSAVFFRRFGLRRESCPRRGNTSSSRRSRPCASELPPHCNCRRSRNRSPPGDCRGYRNMWSSAHSKSCSCGCPSRRRCTPRRHKRAADRANRRAEPWRRRFLRAQS